MASAALAAFVLDITDERHRSRVMGIRGSVGALGDVMGPLLAALVSGVTTSREVFTTSAVVLAVAALLGLVALKGRRRVVADLEDMTVGERAPVAVASLRGLVGLRGY